MTQNTPIVKLEKLTKYYGSMIGIADLSLTVKQGEIFGFLGPNGAGKTTTIRLLLGLIKPSNGSIQLFGKDLTSHLKKCKRKIGYLPGDLGLYVDFTGIQYLNHFLKLRKEEVDETINHRLDSLMNIFNIDFKKKIKFYSKGMRQILGIIQAFMHEPQLIILDEPTTGLDPIMQEKFYELLKEYKTMGKTIFLSSHILSEVERVCDRVGIIKKGRYVSTEELGESRVFSGKKITLTFSSKQIPEGIKNLNGVKELRMVNDKFVFFYQGEMSSLIRRLDQTDIIDLLSETPSIEDTFFTYYKE